MADCSNLSYYLSYSPNEGTTREPLYLSKKNRHSVNNVYLIWRISLVGQCRIGWFHWQKVFRCPNVKQWPKLQRPSSTSIKVFKIQKEKFNHQ